MDGACDRPDLTEERGPDGAGIGGETFRGGHAGEQRLEQVVPRHHLVGEVDGERPRHQGGEGREVRNGRMLVAHQLPLATELPRRLGCDAQDDRTLAADVDAVGVVVGPESELDSRSDTYLLAERPAAHRTDLVSGHRLLGRTRGALHRSEVHGTSKTSNGRLVVGRIGRRDSVGRCQAGGMLGVVRRDGPLAGAHPPRLFEKRADLGPVRPDTVEQDAHPVPDVGGAEVPLGIGGEQSLQLARRGLHGQG